MGVQVVILVVVGARDESHSSLASALVAKGTGPFGTHNPGS